MQRTRIYGPYRDEKRGRWTVIIYEEGARSARRFASEEEAHKFIAEVEEELKLEGPITVEAALEDYEKHLVSRGCKPATGATTMQRLRSLLATAGNGPLVRVHAVDAYARLAASGVAADTHRNALGETRTFGKWAVKMGHLRRSPWEGIEPIGRRRKGKKQLRVDEARLWLDKAVELADLGDNGAVAAMATYLCALRATSVVVRVGRDLDDNGWLLHIERDKTGDRTVTVPEVLRYHLLRLAANAGANGYLFPATSKRTKAPHQSRYWVREQVKRICKLAKVPEVCAQAMRGGHATQGAARGSMPQELAASLGHANSAVTLAHYAQPGAVAAGAQERLLKVLAGGRK